MPALMPLRLRDLVRTVAPRARLSPATRGAL